MARYIGVDLHRNCFTACTRSETGRSSLHEWRLNKLGEFVKKLKADDEVAVEVTGNSRLFHDAVAPHVARVTLVNPNQFKVINESVKKTDAHDAQLLALFLAKGLLPEVRLKGKEHADVASLTQTRDKLVKLRTTLKNKINNILSARGLNLAKEALSSDRALNSALAALCEDVARAEVEIMVEQIRSLSASITKLEKLIKREAGKLKGYENLRSIKGIGELGAAILLSVIGDIRDFPDASRLAAYFGIVPRVNQSNETERSGRITKRGSKLGRTTLVQCALIAKRYCPYLDNYYERVRRRRGTGKAIVALARKLLSIVYRTLKNDWIFADFPNFVLAEAA